MQHVFFRTLFGAAPCPKADRWLCGTSRPPGIVLARKVALNTNINWQNMLHEMCTYPNEILFQIQSQDSQAEHAKCQSCRTDTVLRNHVNMIQPVPLRNRCWKPSEPLPKCHTQCLRVCSHNAYATALFSYAGHMLIPLMQLAYASLRGSGFLLRKPLVTQVLQLK